MQAFNILALTNLLGSEQNIVYHKKAGVSTYFLANYNILILFVTIPFHDLHNPSI